MTAGPAWLPFSSSPTAQPGPPAPLLIHLGEPREGALFFFLPPSCRLSRATPPLSLAPHPLSPSRRTPSLPRATSLALRHARSSRAAPLSSPWPLSAPWAEAPEHAAPATLELHSHHVACLSPLWARTYFTSPYPLSLSGICFGVCWSRSLIPQPNLVESELIFFGLRGPGRLYKR